MMKQVKKSFRKQARAFYTRFHFPTTVERLPDYLKN